MVKVSSVLLGLMVGFALVTPVWAQGGQPPAQAMGLTPQQKLMVKQAAERDAQRKLAEQIFGLRITSNTFVRDFVTQNDEIRTAMDQFIKGVKFGDPRYMEDGSCEVDAVVTLKTIITHLQEVHKRYYKGDVFKAEDFQKITQENKFTDVKVTGNGAPGGGPAPVVGGPQPYRLKLPEIWIRYGPQARLMAKRGAEVDAQRRLAEQIYGLHITSTTFVRDFVTQNDEIKTAMEQFIKGVKLGEPDYQPDGVCSVEASVTLKTVITHLEESYKRYYKGDVFKAEDFQRMSQEIKLDVIKAVGNSALDVTQPPPGAQPVPPQGQMAYPTPTGQVEIKKETKIEVTIEGEDPSAPPPPPAPQQ